VDGAEVVNTKELLTGMEMHEQEGGLSRIELRFVNVVSAPKGSATLAFDNKNFDFGKQLTVYTGDETGPMEIFRGLITGLEAIFPEHAAPEFVVLAEDELQKTRFQRQTRFHSYVTLRDLASNVADTAELGSGPMPDTDTGDQMQLNESDLAFLRRVMGRYDVDAQASGGELQCATRQSVRRAEVALEMHGQLRKARVCADLSHQATEVTASGWDATQGRKVTASSKGENLGPGSGMPGSEAFRKAFGERSEHLSHMAVASNDEARRVAASAFDQRARGFVTLHAEAEGNPRLRAGTHVAVTGLGKRFDNTYYVTRACHVYTLGSGYKTEFTAECAFVGAV
jgi:phage protein D